MVGICLVTFLRDISRRALLQQGGLAVVGSRDAAAEAIEFTGPDHQNTLFGAPEPIPAKKRKARKQLRGASPRADDIAVSMIATQPERVDLDRGGPARWSHKGPTLAIDETVRRKTTDEHGKDRGGSPR
jgi:hypothetical protein